MAHRSYEKNNGNASKHIINSNAQVSIEFMMTTAMMILIFTAIFVMSREKTQDNMNFESASKLRQACEYVSGLISDTYNNGDGTRMTGRVDNYNITIIGNDNLIITWIYKSQKTNQTYNCKILNIPVTNGYNSTFNIEKMKTFTIENVKGTVEIRKTEYEDGLILWLRMDGNNTRTTTKDSGPSDYVPTLIRKASCVTAGFRALGCSFDGTEDAISLSDSNILNNRQEATISMWVKWTGTQAYDSSGYGPYGPVISRKGASFNNNLLGLSSASPASAYIVWNPYNTASALVGTTAIGDGIWRHVVISFRNGNHSIYINGTLDKSSAMTGTISNDATVALMIGEWNSGTGVYFKGMVDDLRIYSRSLNGTEVKQLYDMYLSFYKSYPTAIPG